MSFNAQGDADSYVVGEGPADDLFTWLSAQWWLPWVMFVGFSAVGLWMVRSMVMHRGRERRIERVAMSAGMRYREQDGHGLSKISFHHMARGDGRGWTASNVVSFDAKDGITSHGFDVRVWTEFVVAENRHGERRVRGRRPGHGTAGATIKRRHQGATRTAAMAPLPFNSPRLVIARENVVSKIFNAAARIDIDFESELFNRSYHVIGSDRDFATRVLDARMIDLMTQTEGRISFEFSGTWLLLHTDRLQPSLVPGLVRLADEMRRVVPRSVVDRWPTAGQPGFEAIPR